MTSLTKAEKVTLSVHRIPGNAAVDGVKTVSIEPHSGGKMLVTYHHGEKKTPVLVIPRGFKRLTIRVLKNLAGIPADSGNRIQFGFIKIAGFNFDARFMPNGRGQMVILEMTKRNCRSNYFGAFGG